MAMKALVFTLIVSANMAHGIDVRKLVGGMREQRAMAAHDDASTGTVTEVTKEQEAVGHAALTCDSIMAKSLVLANEQKAHAEVRRESVRSRRARCRGDRRCADPPDRVAARGDRGDGVAVARARSRERH